MPAYNSGLSKGLGTGRFSGQGMFLELDCYGSNHVHHLLTVWSRAGYIYINTRPPVLSDHELLLALSQLHMKLMQT